MAGAGLARGYWKQAALTAERFLPDPFGPPGSRMYRTGDIGRTLSDGNIEFVGRIDDQVKILGHRIELGEVEAAIRGLDGVRDVALVARQDDPQDDPRLVAYVVADDFSESAARDRLTQLLPAAMRPAAFVMLAQLPISPLTTKLDRSRLPACEPRRLLPMEDASELECAVAARYQHSLGHMPATMTASLPAAAARSGPRLIGRLAQQPASS